MAQRAPLIGISMYGRENGRFSLPVEYVDAVRSAGGVPLLLAPGEARAERCLDAIDGLIVAGGGDVNPARYGGSQHARIDRVDDERDAAELEAVGMLLESGIPSFCICRGMQVLNCALGGSLVEHLPEPNGAGVLHRSPEGDPIPHAVAIENGSLLGEISGALETETISWHHQAVRDLGSDLDVVARARDGVIEALQHASHPWLLAVQWHPELSAATDPVQQKLFDALVRQAASIRR